MDFYKDTGSLPLHLYDESVRTTGKGCLTPKRTAWGDLFVEDNGKARRGLPLKSHRLCRWI